MRYDGQYLWPPRPGKKQVIPPTQLGAREALGAWAQIKKQGTSNVMFVGPDRRVRAMNRHNAEHRQWQPIEATHQAFAALPGRGTYVFCAELLHHKVADPALKHINYIHDILVADDDYLAGTTFRQRQKLLAALFPTTVPPLQGVGYRVIDRHTWLAVNYLPSAKSDSFTALFRGLTRPEDEGLVMKMPDARLRFCLKETSNDDWQFKCRRPTKNAPF